MYRKDTTHSLSNKMKSMGIVKPDRVDDYEFGHSTSSHTEHESNARHFEHIHRNFHECNNLYLI